jgi:putative hydrolase of the HAD superfamily
MIDVIAFDADDTLWHNEHLYRDTQRQVAEILLEYHDAAWIESRMYETEIRNLEHYGYGMKGFTLSMIETAIEVTEGRVPASVIAELIAAGREMLRHPVELLPKAREAIEALAGRYRVLLITKGDLLDQERKLAQSGLGDLFDGVEIVSEKTPSVYARIFDEPGRSMMVGNSLRSDVLPAIEAGAWGTFVPHGLTWEHEHAETPVGQSRFREIAGLGELSGLIGEVEAI